MNASDCDNDENFEDASEIFSEMDLSTAMEQAKLAVDAFFNNKFEEAKRLMEPWADRSIYHALGYGSFMYLQAVMTFDPNDIEAAVNVLKQSVEVCNKKRKKTSIGESIGKIVKKPDYSTFTEEEIHAELCYAECLLLRAILSFIEDETLISFLKGSMKIRACYQSYRACWQILQSRDFSNDKEQIHFESGVKMGVGTFNLMITQLPSKILKLLEFVGFAPSRSLGLTELKEGFALEGSLRKVMCGLCLLVYQTFAVYAFGTSDGDIENADSILQEMVKTYPNGALIQFFSARVNFIKGNFIESTRLYNKSRLSQSEWRQFHHICYWELFWCHFINGHYREAEECASILLEESKWSKATYAYMKACCLCMRKESLSDFEKEELRSTMRIIPDLKQRIAGKSLPVEKFALKKSLRYFDQNENLILAGIELLYIFNQMKIVKKSYPDIERLYLICEEEINKLNALPSEDRGDYFWDNFLLCQFLKGICLSNMKSPLQAAECFKIVISNEKKIKQDTYIMPYSLLEVALLHVNAGDLDQAKIILDHIKNNCKGFSLESRLHFRIHSTNHLIKRLKNLENNDSSTQNNCTSLDKGTLLDISSAVGNANGSTPPLNTKL